MKGKNTYRGSRIIESNKTRYEKHNNDSDSTNYLRGLLNSENTVHNETDVNKHMETMRSVGSFLKGMGGQQMSMNQMDMGQQMPISQMDMGQQMPMGQMDMGQMHMGQQMPMGQIDMGQQMPMGQTDMGQMAMNQMAMNQMNMMGANNMMGQNFNINNIDPLHVETLAPVHNNMQMNMPSQLLDSRGLANSLSHLGALNNNNGMDANAMSALSIDAAGLQDTAFSNKYAGLNNDANQLGNLVSNNNLMNLSKLNNMSQMNMGQMNMGQGLQNLAYLQ